MARRRLTSMFSVAVGIPLLLVLAIYGWKRHHFPFGASHCCDLILYRALEEYAANHGGAFPTGESSPEASLSLLFGAIDWVNADLLRGKSVPLSIVEGILTQGDRLGPDSCGWHYVEGLRLDDHPKLALFWDKAGLDHNGGRLAQGGHIVLFIDGQRNYVAGAEWPEFVQEQQRLLAERANGGEIRVDAVFQVDDEPMQVQLRVLDYGLYARVWRKGFSSSGQLLAVLKGSSSSIRGLPEVTPEEIRNASAVTDQGRGHVRFLLEGREIIFDGSNFRFQKTIEAEELGSTSNR